MDRAVIERIARLAQRTPSAGFSQGQRLVVVTDPEPAARRSSEDLRRGGVLRGVRAVDLECRPVHPVRERDDLPPAVLEPTRPSRTVRIRLAGAVLVGRHRRDDAERHARRRERRPGCGSAGNDADGWERLKSSLAILEEFVPIGVMPVGRPLPDVRLPSLKRAGRPSREFARWGSGALGSRPSGLSPARLRRLEVARGVARGEVVVEVVRAVVSGGSRRWRRRSAAGHRR